MIDKPKKFINRSQRLFIELGTPLLLEPDTPERAVSSQLIGMQVGSYLIVQLTENNWRQARLTPNETLSVRYILSDDVFAFKTSVIRMLQNPDYLLFLNYPDVVESCNIRTEKRVECFLPVRIILDRFCMKGIIVNINRSGCLCLVNDAPFPEPCSFDHLILSLPYAQSETLNIRADIRSIRKKGHQTSIGLMFKSLDGFSKNVLSALVPALKI